MGFETCAPRNLKEEGGHDANDKWMIFMLKEREVNMQMSVWCKKVWIFDASHKEEDDNMQNEMQKCKEDECFDGNSSRLAK